MNPPRGAQEHLPSASAEQLFAHFGTSVSESTARPPDVARAKSHFNAQDYTPQQREWANLVAEAIEQLGGARIMVNRPADDVLDLLTRGGRISTLFDLKKPSEEVKAYLVNRKATEVRLGTHGAGAHAGQTVYGSVEFSAFRSPELVDDKLLKAGKAKKLPPRPLLDTGISLTNGAVTLVMKTEANLKSTFLPGDSYIAGAHRPRTIEALPYVVLDNILEQGDMYFSSDKGSDVMFELPHDQALVAIKSYLSSSALNRSYLEAQIRSPSLDDVAYVVIRAAQGTERPQFDGRPDAQVLADIRALAAQRGLPVVDESSASRAAR